MLPRSKHRSGIGYCKKILERYSFGLTVCDSWGPFATMGNVWRLNSEWGRFLSRFLVRGRTEPFWMYGFPSVANRFPVHYWGATYIWMTTVNPNEKCYILRGKLCGFIWKKHRLFRLGSTPFLPYNYQLHGRTEEVTHLSTVVVEKWRVKSLELHEHPAKACSET